MRREGGLTTPVARENGTKGGGLTPEGDRHEREGDPHPASAGVIGGVVRLRQNGTGGGFGGAASLGAARRSMLHTCAQELKPIQERGCAWSPRRGRPDPPPQPPRTPSRASASSRCCAGSDKEAACRGRR